MEEGGRNNLIQPPAISVDTTNIMCDIDEKWQKLKIIFANDNLLDVTSFTQTGYQRSHSFVDKLLASENKRRERERADA